jgi:hypothetical protein
MTNKPKIQGTKHETWIVDRLKAAGIYARRIAEGGSKDIGDVLAATEDGGEWVIEAKATQTLNVTRVLGKALDKSGVKNTALIWKRLTKSKGNTNRTPDGVPVVVVLSFESFVQLLNNQVTK